MKTPDVTKEEFLEAVRQGVYDAVWDAITDATLRPCRNLFETIGAAVERATLEREKLRVVKRKRDL
jgi:hypothetical protein